MIALLAAVALAGWVRVPVAAPASEISFSPPVGDGVLIRLSPDDVPFVVTDGGTPTPVRAGPEGAWWIPPADRSRVLTVKAEVPVRVERWEDTGRGEPRRWTRYARQIARWCRVGGELPVAPGPLDGLDALWVARREALRAAGEDSVRLCTAAAWLEIEAVRARGAGDHVRTDFARAAVPTGGTMRADVRGPGVFVVDAKAVLAQGDARADVVVSARLNGVPVARLDRTAGEDPDTPGLAWNRRLEVVVPPGSHRVAVDVVGEPVRIEARMERMRLPVGRARLFDDLVPTGPVSAMEVAVLTGGADLLDLAEPLMEGPASDLARARFIANHPNGDVVLARVGDALGPLSRAAWARRVRVLSDVPASVLLDAPTDWLFDPHDVAAVLRAVDPSAVRPRDAAARRLADRHVVSTGTVRWRSLDPEGPFEIRRIDGAVGGSTRVRVDAGQQVDVAVADLRQGMGHLRMVAPEAVRYRVDGRPRYGLGRVDEAVHSGAHTVTVDEGTLWLLDDDAVTGGVQAQEVPVAPLPAEWVVPEPGFPARIALSSSRAGADLVVTTGDGRIWPVHTTEAPTIIDITPISSRVSIDGPPDLEVSVAMQQAVLDRRPLLPLIKGEPLDRIREISQQLTTARPESGTDIAALRLERAAALVALGLTGTARRELNAVAGLPGATPIQRALAVVPLPAPLRADDIGPITAEAALAMSGRLPPTSDTGAAWLAAARMMDVDLADRVYARAAERLRDEGQPVAAVAAAQEGGPQAAAVARQIAVLGRWQRVQAVERHGGVVEDVLARTPPDEDASLFARVREALLGAPWLPSTYTVLRGGRRNRLVLEGPATVELHLLCRDETLAASPRRCDVDVGVDELEERVRAPEGEIVVHAIELAAGRHEVTVDPRRRGSHALVVRVERAGEVVPPQLHVTAHLVGPGIRTTIAGPTLLRVRALRNGPLTVTVDGKATVVSDERVIPVLSSAASVVTVEGAPDAWADSALWEALSEDLIPPPVPPPARYIVPAAEGPVADSARAWIGSLRDVRRPDLAPPGAPGTTEVRLTAVDDAIGARDDVRHYRVADTVVAYHTALGGRWWGRGTVRGRLSLDGPAGVGADVRGWWVTSGGHVELGLRSMGSAGAGHVRALVEGRRTILSRSLWRLEAFGGVRAGWWSRAAPTNTDPVVWNAFSADHPVALTVGGVAVWRPALDVRVRGTLQAVSNADPSLDRLEAALRLDAIARDEFVLTGVWELGLRLADRHRGSTALRPILGADARWSGWPSLRDGTAIEAGFRWLPVSRAAEASIGFRFERSRARGLLDRPPPEVLFRELRDVAREAR